MHHPLEPAPAPALRPLGVRLRRTTVVAAAVALGALTVALAPAASASATPSRLASSTTTPRPAPAFGCVPGFYQVSRGRLSQLDPVTGADEPIGDADAGYAALGYDTLDGYLYAVSTGAGSAGPPSGHLMRIDSRGEPVDLGTPAGLPAGSPVIGGDFDDRGDLLIRSSATDYYSVDVASMTAAPFTVTGSAAPDPSDVVWDAGSLYSIEGDELHVVDLRTHVETAHALTGVPNPSDGFTAGYSDRAGDLYFTDGTTGRLYHVTGQDTSSPAAEVVGTGPASPTTTGPSDGAACKDAASPFYPPTAQDDAYPLGAGPTLRVDAAHGVLVNDAPGPLHAVLTSGATDGTVQLHSDGSFTYTAAPGAPRADSFTYTALDRYGRASSRPATVRLTDTPPAAPTAQDETVTVTAGTTRAVDAGAGLLSHATGTDLTIGSTGDPVHGTVTTAADGSFTYAADDSYCGRDRFRYTVLDPYGQTAVATATVVVVPLAAPQVYPDTAGHVLTVTAPGVLARSAGRELAAATSSTPAHGTLRLRGDGSFDYTPDAGFQGTDSFAYRATGAGVSSAVATVRLTVTPAGPPTARADTYRTDAGQTLHVPAGTGLLADDTGDELHVTATTRAGHGHVTRQADGSFGYTPEQGYSGVDAFSYTATDAAGRTATAAVRLTVSPLAVADRYLATDGQDLVVGTATGVLRNDLGRGLRATLRTSPGYGTLQLQPDGGLTYRPLAGFRGTDGFSYAATDASGQASTAHVRITVRASDGPGGGRSGSIGTLPVPISGSAPASTTGPAPAGSASGTTSAGSATGTPAGSAGGAAPAGAGNQGLTPSRTAGTDPAPSGLASTGATVRGYLITGGGLLLLGAALLLLAATPSRRRRGRAHPYVPRHAAPRAPYRPTLLTSRAAAPVRGVVQGGSWSQRPGRAAPTG